MIGSLTLEKQYEKTGFPCVRVSPDMSCFVPLSGRPGGFSEKGQLSWFLSVSSINARNTRGIHINPEKCVKSKGHED